MTKVAKVETPETRARKPLDEMRARRRRVVSLLLCAYGGKDDNILKCLPREIFIRVFALSEPDELFDEHYRFIKHECKTVRADIETYSPQLKEKYSPPHVAPLLSALRSFVNKCELRDNKGLKYRLAALFVGVCSFFAGDDASVKKWLTPICDCDNPEWGHWSNFYIGEVHIMSGQYAKAIPYLKKCAESVHLYSRLGYCYHMSGDIDTAHTYNEMVVKCGTAGNYVYTAHYALATYYQRKADNLLRSDPTGARMLYKLAHDHFEKVISMTKRANDPIIKHARADKAHCTYGMGNTAVAITFMAELYCEVARAKEDDELVNDIRNKYCTMLYKEVRRLHERHGTIPRIHTPLSNLSPNVADE